MAKKVAQGNNNHPQKKSSSERDWAGLNLKDEITKEFPREFWEQITVQKTNHQAEIYPGQTIRPQEKTETPQQQINHQERLHFKQRHNLAETSLKIKNRQETTTKINQIREEIKTIAANMNQINRQVEEIDAVAQENVPQESQYQLNFLELLLTFLNDLRERVEEGNTWLTTFQKRSQKKGRFWNQVKKSGTKFLLSADRTPATQTG
ncbi:MAG: DUF5660 family protein [Patescibacteria group bacterium]|jgi:hypothetical protein